MAKEEQQSFVVERPDGLPDFPEELLVSVKTARQRSPLWKVVRAIKPTNAQVADFLPQIAVNATHICCVEENGQRCNAFVRPYKDPRPGKGSWSATTASITQHFTPTHCPW
jgi:hypothetical protein